MIKLEEMLGYEFKNRAFLETALTHSSYANEHRRLGIECNERLEFLGDSILGMVTADFLFRNELCMPEGKMTRLRAELVCERSLAETADVLKLGEYLRLGRGEENGGGRSRPSIKADAVEAVLAAVYLDGGMAEVRRIIYKFILSKFKNGAEDNRDYKTLLQEFLQRDGAKDIAYCMVEQSGPDHDKTFPSQVCLDGSPIGEGTGRSKKASEQMAAKNALEKLKNEA